MAPTHELLTARRRPQSASGVTIHRLFAPFAEVEGPWTAAPAVAAPGSHPRPSTGGQEPGVRAWRLAVATPQD